MISKYLLAVATAIFASQTYAYSPGSEFIRLAPRGSLAFNQLVACGDELSNNGNGPYAHGKTGNPATSYGLNTRTKWADCRLILTDMLHVPLTDYAWGSRCNGDDYGATLITA